MTILHYDTTSKKQFPGNKIYLSLNNKLLFYKNNRYS